MTEIILIRHGESQSNIEKVYAGNMDVPLTEKGLLQAQVTADYLKNKKIDAFYSSPLDRAYRTVKALADDRNMSVTKVENLHEIYGGRWQGLTYTRIFEKFPKDYKLWLDNIGIARATGGESAQEVRERITAAIREIVQKHDGQTICIGLHAMALRMFISKVKKLDKNDVKNLPWPHNSSITTVLYENGDFSLKEYSFNDHLGELNTNLPKNV